MISFQFVPPFSVFQTFPSAVPAYNILAFKIDWPMVLILQTLTGLDGSFKTGLIAVAAQPGAALILLTFCPPKNKILEFNLETK